MSTLNTTHADPALGGGAIAIFNVFLLALDLFGGRRD